MNVKTISRTFLFLIVCLSLSLSSIAQEPTSPPLFATNTPSVAGDAEPVDVVVEPSEDAADQVDQITTWLMAVISTVIVVTGMFGKDVWSVGLFAILMTGAVNLARLTESTKDDEQIAKVIADGGGEINKDGAVWVVMKKA